MRKVTVALLALLLVVAMVGTTMAQAPTIQPKSPTAPHNAVPTAPVNPLAVLWDQPASTTNTNAYADQDFETAYDAYDIFVADDFVTDPNGWTLTNIFVPGDGWNGFSSIANANTLNFQIYADNAGVPGGDPWSGGAVWSLSVAPSDPQITITIGDYGFPSDVLLTLSTPIVLPAGTYWFAFYPQLDFGLGYGQYGRNLSTTANLLQAMVINPGGGFGFPTTWSPAPPLYGFTEYEFAFRLEGFITPPSNTMHVGAVNLTKTGTGPWVLTGKGQIHDAAHVPLAAVLVQAQWLLPNGTKVYRSFSTGAQGGYGFNLNVQGQGQFRFCVVGLTKVGWTYDKTANHPSPPCKYINTP
jgi:hypothetical protein